MTENLDQVRSENFIFERVEAKLEKRFFGIFSIIGGLAAVIVALCGVVGTLMIQNFTADARAEFEAARQMQAVSSDELAESQKRSQEIIAILEEQADDIRASRELSQSILAKLEGLSVKNVEISQRLFDRISEIVAKFEQQGIAIDSQSRDQLRDLGKLLDEAKRVAESLPNATIQVGIVAYNTDTEKLTELENLVYGELSFTRRGVMQPRTRPYYLSASSSVLFYDEANLEMATTISEFASAIFGQEFDVREGAGVGVKSEDRPSTIIIHVVGDN